LHHQLRRRIQGHRHHKIIIIDKTTLITGSFNFTKAAEEKTSENLLVLKGNKPLAERYIRNFEEHKGHAETYQESNFVTTPSYYFKKLGSAAKFDRQGYFSKAFYPYPSEKIK